MKSILIKNIGQLILGHTHAVKDSALANLPTVSDAFLLIEDGRIKDFGNNEIAPENADEIFDAKGGFVFPSFVDSHTHLVFAASREQEFVDRINGLSYEEISARGGGILNSARKLQAADEDFLFENAMKRLEEVIQFGTGAIEIKSGYGLTLDSELKMLRVIRRIKEASNIPVKATFLGAHSIPMEFRGDRKVYVDKVVDEMLPQVVFEGLADFIDVFCEKVAFTVEETERIMEAGQKMGLPAKIHTNQFFSLGGIEASVKYGARSVDHLEVVNDDEIKALQNSKTIATLLPSAPFFLNQGHFPPARKLIDAGITVALASDYNPGTTPSGKMPFVLSLACINMRMLPNEAFNAATINGAAAIDLEEDYGSITRGKVANLFLTGPLSSTDFLPYAFGSNLIEKVMVKGVWH
ncbi:MAG: imidazolonepropionase [Saprospiraceae bacterium]